tara:strand:- start:433 stop:2193 length:1761 start_codon:yes stop_codon:yes gene_type:complete
MTEQHTVLLPVCRGVIHATIEKGDQWSEVEHFVLYALSQNEFTMTELSKKMGLIKVVVAEAVTRLMRAGWVEIKETQDRISFKASLYGLAVVENVNLPPTVKEITKKLGFVIDYVGGVIFPSRNFVLIKEEKAKQILTDRESEGMVHLLQRRVINKELPGNVELFEKLLTNRDEHFKRYDPLKSWLSDDWYVRLVITGKEIEGLPNNTPAYLKQRILNDLELQKSAEGGNSADKQAISAKVPSWQNHQIEFGNDDLIIGGNEHKAILRGALENACHRVIVHSTFIELDRLSEQIDDLISATSRGVKVDILWDKAPQNGASKKLRLCKALLQKHNLKRSVYIHANQTDSHAKILIADDGKESYYAVIGSCNWLYSGFHSVDVSVKLRSPQVVADCIKVIDKLAFPLGKASGPLQQELLIIHSHLKGMDSAITGTACAQIVRSADHNMYMRKARDEAQHNIFLASHRLGGVVETQVLIPADNVAHKETVDISVYYQQASGPAQEATIVDALKTKYKDSIKIRNVARAHAKFLGWDNDHVVITSLNWLSKDTNEDNSLGEVGVYIQAPGIADYLHEQYLSKISKAGSED